MEVNKNIPILFQSLNHFEDNDTRFMQVKIWLMHLQENLNGSYFEKSVVEDAIHSLANTPILAYVEDNSDGENDFSDHRMVLVKEEGKYKIKYIGQAIGVIPETNNAQFEKRVCDDGIEREFLTVEGLVWQNKWDDAPDILNRDLIKAQSMELHDDYEGEFKEDNLFHFTKFKFYGACGLGKNVLPAMQNATIEVQFSFDGFKKEIQEKMEQFKQFSLQNQSSTTPEVDDINFSKKEDKELDERLELVNKYNLTVEQLDFSIEELSLEDLELKLKEFSSNDNSNDTKATIEFSATYRQKREALSNALDPKIEKDSDGNITYEEYLWVEDFDDTYVYVEKSIWTPNNYERTYGRFTYTFDEKSITASITSEFEKMILVWLTEDENAKIQSERENYSKLQDEFNEYKNNYSTLNSEVERLQNFEKTTLEEQRTEAETSLYAQFEKLNGVEEFEELKKNASQYSIEELEEKCFAIYGKKNANFSTNKKEKSTVKININQKTDEGYKPYGDLFDKYTN